jgi:hypothetical protein
MLVSWLGQSTRAGFFVMTSAILGKSSIFPLLSSRLNSPGSSPLSASFGATIEPGPPCSGRVVRRSVRSQARMRRKIMSQLQRPRAGSARPLQGSGIKEPLHDSRKAVGTSGILRTVCAPGRFLPSPG